MELIAKNLKLLKPQTIAALESTFIAQNTQTNTLGNYRYSLMVLSSYCWYYVKHLQGKQASGACLFGVCRYKSAQNCHR